MFNRMFLITFLTVFTGYSSVFASDAEEDAATIAAFNKSVIVKSTSDVAYGYAVFPTIGKGGFGIGAAHGKGRVYAAGKMTGNTSMTQVSFGLQAGGQAYSQVVFLEDERAFKDFTSGSFEFSAQAEAIAITASAGASAGTEGVSASVNEKQSAAKFTNGIVVFTMAKGGLMYQAAIGGQKYSYEASK